jgi:flagellar biogenesis protein FliO
MASQFVGLDQLIIIVSFLSVMMLGWLLVRRYRGRIVRNLTSGKRLRLLEETSLSPQERLRLVAVDGQHFLIVSAKGQAPAITPVENTPVENAPAITPGENTPVENALMGGAAPARPPVSDPRPAGAVGPALLGERRQPLELTRAAGNASGKQKGRGLSLASAIARARAQNPALGLDK